MKTSPNKIFSTYKIAPNTTINQQRQAQAEDYSENPLDSGRGSQTSKPELASELSMNFNSSRDATTEGMRKRKSLFPQERKVSINLDSARTPLIEGSERGSKFLKKYGHTPDVGSLKKRLDQRTNSPRNSLIFV